MTSTWQYLLALAIMISTVGCPDDEPDLDGDGASDDSVDTSGDDSGGGDSGPIEPLLASEFAYVHTPTAGVSHIRVFDHEAGTSWLLTNLDDDGDYGTNIGRTMTLSPDGKRVAFAGWFRPSQADLDAGVAVPLLWTVSADGTDFQRVSPAVSFASDNCAAEGCPSGSTCNPYNDACVPNGWGIEISHIAWSSDSSQLWYAPSIGWISGGQLVAGARPRRIAAAGGVPELFDISDPACSFVSTPSPSTDDRFLYMDQVVCLGGSVSGFGVWTLPNVEQLGAVRRNDIVPNRAPMWSTNSPKVLYYLADMSWDTSGDGVTDVAGISLVGYDGNGGDEFGVLLPIPGKTFLDVAIDADDTRIVACMEDASTHTTDLYLFDYTTTDPGVQPEPRQLTTDGRSCWPSWRY